MAVLIKKNATLAIIEENVMGVAEVPSSTDFIKANSDAITINPTVEALTQSLLGTGIGLDRELHGKKGVTGSIGMPLTTSLTEGGKSPLSVALKSLLGSETILASQSTSAATTTVLTFADPHGYRKNDVVIVKTAGAYEARPILSVTSLTITLKWALSTAPDAVTEVAPIRNYRPSCNHSSFTVVHQMKDCTSGADSIIVEASGCKAGSMNYDNFATNQLADATIAFEGLKYKRTNGSPVAASYTQAERSAIVNAVIYQNGALFSINEFGFSIANKFADLSDTKNGRTELKVISREVTGKLNPYLVTGAGGLSQWQLFDTNASFSLFVVQSNPTAIEGQPKNYIATWTPNCQISALESGDFNDHITDNVSFKAFNTEDEDEVFIAIS